MKQNITGAGIILCILFVLFTKQYFVPQWKQQTEEVLYKALVAGVNEERWQEVDNNAQQLPNIPPFTVLKKTILETSVLMRTFNLLPPLSHFSLDKPIMYHNIEAYIDWYYKAEGLIKRVQKQTRYIPTHLLSNQKKEQVDSLKMILQKSEHWTSSFESLIDIYFTLKQGKDRVLIVFQNENEARPTGGFGGSLAFVDFTPHDLQISFHDIYALDRLVPESAQRPAPAFFTPLDDTLSLRDANFSPHFPASAQEYQHYFTAIGKRVPSTIIAVDTELIKVFLEFLNKPIYLEEWGVTITSDNMDLVLSYLVEGKVAGRMDVKAPVFALLKEILNQVDWGSVVVKEDTVRRFMDLIKERHIQAWSENDSIEKQFRNWGIDGAVVPPQNADDFLQIDMINIGANKSDRFMKTNVVHDSTVSPDGGITNRMTIRRTHTLKNGDIERILGIDGWPENIQRILPEVRYVLGDSQNRTIMRLMVPKGSTLVRGESISGPVRIYPSSDVAAEIIEVPIYVSPGEFVEVIIEYNTHTKRGSSAWRPYHFTLLTTPAREQSTFIKTMTAVRDSTIVSETENINTPVNLTKQDFRVIVEFE